jgi:hypothetical protein
MVGVVSLLLPWPLSSLLRGSRESLMSAGTVVVGTWVVLGDPVGVVTAEVAEATHHW